MSAKPLNLGKILGLILSWDDEEAAAAGTIRQDTPATAAGSQPTEASQPGKHTSGQQIVKTGGER